MTRLSEPGSRDVAASGQCRALGGAGAGQTTGLDFVRRSTVSLSGPWGEIRLGRDFAPSYLSLISFDVWSVRGFGAVNTFGPGVANALGSYSTLR